MLYGITASEWRSQTSYVANAVTFNDARLSLASLACTDNAYFSFAGWFSADWDYSGNYTYAFVIDPSGGTGSWFNGNSDNSATLDVTDGANFTGGIIAAGSLTPSIFQHIIGTVQTSPSRIVKCYVDDVDVSATLSVFGPTYTPITSNGKTLSVGGDGYGDYYAGDMADLSIWPGVSFLTAGDISQATRRLFIDADGNPVDPAVAITSLGTPAVMLSGNASTFHLNTLGSSGALTLAEGTITNASTHP